MGKRKDTSQGVEVGAAVEGDVMLYLEGIRLQSLTGVQGTHRVLGRGRTF